MYICCVQCWEVVESADSTIVHNICIYCMLKAMQIFQILQSNLKYGDDVSGKELVERAKLAHKLRADNVQQVMNSLAAAKRLDLCFLVIMKKNVNYNL